MEGAGIRHGVLSSGRAWKVAFSRRSAVEGKGTHYVLSFVGESSIEETPFADQKEALGVALEVARELSAAICLGNFRIEFNGPFAAVRSHFHVHIICVEANVKLRRSTDSIVEAS